MKTKNGIVLLGIVALFTLIAVTATASAAVPTGNMTWLEPENSSAGYCNTTKVEVWAYIDDPNGCAGGSINLTYDPGCANVTKWKRDKVAWLYGTWDSSVDGKEWITFAIDVEEVKPHIGTVKIGTLTIHCNSTSFCITPLIFDKGSSLIAKPPPPGLSYPIDVKWKNGTFTCGEARMPDLVIKDKYEEWVNVAKKAYNITYTVSNVGDAPAGRSNTSIFIDYAETPIIEDPVPPLEPDECYTNTMGPLIMSGDNDTIEVYADNNNKVNESNEENNYLENVFEYERMPDLVIEKNVTVDDGKFIVNYIVTNIGTAPAGAANSTTCKLVDGELMECQPCPILKPGESYSGSFMPEPCPCGAILNVTVCADYQNFVNESNETNNCEVNFVECPPPIPGIEVNKTVWDRVNEVWVDETTANISEIVRFKCEIHNNGTCCPLTNLVVTDILSESLKYVDNATVHFPNCTTVPIEPEPSPAKNVFIWKFPDLVLNPCETITIEFDAHVVKCGVDENIQKATATWGVDGIIVSDEDSATVIVQPKPSIDVTKTVRDPETGEWVDKIKAKVGDVVTFNSTVHNNGVCCNLTSIKVMDTMSDSLKYVNATPQPDEIIVNPDGTTTLLWKIKGPLAPCESLTFIIDAKVTKCGEDWNKQNATAEGCEADVYDEDYAYVNVPGVPSVDVEKTVWDQVNETWVKEITAPLGETVTFNSTVHNDGECCNLTKLTVTDTLSDSFKYVGHYPNITAEIIKNPDGSTTLIWEIPGPLAPCESLTFLINATLIKTGVDTNVQNATAWCGEIMVSDKDTATVHSVRPEGGLGVAVIPRLSPVSAGGSVNLSIKIVSTENFDDVFLVNLTNESLPDGWKADMRWFNWTSIKVGIPAGGEAVIPLRADIPDDIAPGYKAFRAVAESTKWTPTAFDTGIFNIS